MRYLTPCTSCGGQRPVREELVLDQLADAVALPLQVDEVRVQAAVDDVVEPLVGELAVQAADARRASLGVGSRPERSEPL